MGERWPFVGRGEELATLRRAMADGKVTGVAIAGTAGVGKTRLARELLAAAADEGYATEWIAGLGTTESIPLGAFAHLLSVPDSGPVDRLSRLHGMIVEVVRRASERRLVMVLDDAHLLDDASARLVYELAYLRAAFLVPTIRTDQPVPAPIEALWKEERVERLDLGALCESEVEQLLRAVLRVPLESSGLRRLVAASGGNALLLRELVLDALTSTSLVVDGGTARLAGPLVAGPRLQEVVEGRLRRLSRAERTVLELLALGQPLGAGLLERLSCPEAVEGVERRGLLEVTTDGNRVTVRLAHPLYAEALRRALPPLTARSLRRRLAEAVEATGMRRREDLMRVATWRLEAGDGAGADLLVAAAWRAHALMDHGLAERLARAAVNAGGGPAAGVALGEALVGQGRLQEAEAVMERIDLTSADERIRTRLAIARSSNLFWGLGATEAAHRVVHTAVASLRPSRFHDLLVAMEGTLLLFSGRTREALELVSGPVARTGNGNLTTAMAWTVSGQTACALERIDLALEMASRQDQWSLEIPQIRLARHSALWLHGRIAEAEAYAAEALAEAEASRSQELAGYWSGALGWSFLLQGRHRTALARLLAGAEAMLAVDRWRFRPTVLAWAAQAAVLGGDLHGATATLTEARTAGDQHNRLFGVMVPIAEAWVTAAHGELPAASAIAHDAAETAAARGQHAFEALALHDAVRFGATRGEQARLADLAARAQGSLIAWMHCHARALCEEDGAGLDDVAGGFASIGARLWAAEAAVEAALAHGRAGDRARAVASRAVALKLAERCEGALTPTLLRLREPDVDPLTARERQVALLAARGLSSVRIASHCGISARTVDNHLQHVYRKLGVSSRSELAVAFRISRRSAGLEGQGDRALLG